MKIDLDELLNELSKYNTGLGFKKVSMEDIIQSEACDKIYLLRLNKVLTWPLLKVSHKRVSILMDGFVLDENETMNEAAIDFIKECKSKLLLHATDAATSLAFDAEFGIPNANKTK